MNLTKPFIIFAAALFMQNQAQASSFTPNERAVRFSIVSNCVSTATFVQSMKDLGFVHMFRGEDRIHTSSFGRSRVVVYANPDTQQYGVAIQPNEIHNFNNTCPVMFGTVLPVGAN